MHACEVTDIDDHKTLCAIDSCVNVVGCVCCMDNLFLTSTFFRHFSPWSSNIWDILDGCVASSLPVLRTIAPLRFIDSRKPLNAIECCAKNAGRDTVCLSSRHSIGNCFFTFFRQGSPRSSTIWGITVGYVITYLPLLRNIEASFVQHVDTPLRASTDNILFFCLAGHLSTHCSRTFHFHDCVLGLRKTYQTTPGQTWCCKTPHLRASFVSFLFLVQLLRTIDLFSCMTSPFLDLCK